MLLVSSLGIWAEEERESKSLRGVFPFSHVQQQDNRQSSSHSSHHPNIRNPTLSNSQNLHHEHHNTHSSPNHHPDVFHTHHETETDEYYISKVNGVSTKTSPKFQPEPNTNEYLLENTDSVRAIPNRESRQGGGDRDGFGEDIFIDLG